MVEEPPTLTLECHVPSYQMCNCTACMLTTKMGHSRNPTALIMVNKRGQATVNLEVSGREMAGIENETTLCGSYTIQLL